MQSSYTVASKVVAAYEVIDGHSYQQLADTLNRQRVPAPPRSSQWTKWSARHLCRSIGRPSQNGPKIDTARQQVNRSIARLIDCLPFLGTEITVQTLSGASGLSVVTCRKYHDLVDAIIDGRINTTAFVDHFSLWKHWQTIGTLDEEAAPL